MFDKQPKTYGLSDLRGAIVATLQQGCRSSDGDGCLYNLEVDGRTIHCVIGHMVKDDPCAQKVIDTFILGVNSSVERLIAMGGFYVEDRTLLDVFNKAQDIHDITNSEDWLTEYNDLLGKLGVELITQEEVDV